MKKILFVATVTHHITLFHIPHLKLLKEHGWETAVAAHNTQADAENAVIPYCDTYYDVHFERSPENLHNHRAFKQLKKIINSGEYDTIHCHTPVAAFLTRLAAVKARKKGTRVIYTAHGFHFFKGAPALYWMLYFPAEWLASFFTDILITINKEDYAFALKHLHAKRTEYIPGIGVNLKEFGNRKFDKALKRRELAVSDDQFLILAVSELIPRKNLAMLIRAMVRIPDAVLTIAGIGRLQEKLELLIAKLHLENRVKLLGYRNDIAELCEACDVFAFPSFQEGLPVSVMEAMACGKPIVCSRIRGNIELVDQDGGELFDPHSIDDFIAAMHRIRKRNFQELGQHNMEKIKNFSLDIVLPRLQSIYFQEAAKND